MHILICFYLKFSTTTQCHHPTSHKLTYEGEREKESRSLILGGFARACPSVHGAVWCARAFCYSI